MNKELTYGSIARTSIKSGIDKITDAVKVTLGPCGRNVIFERPGEGIVVTKDGVSVATEISFKDQLENIGATIIKDVAGKSNKEVGDGTTTATILARALYESGIKHITAGTNPIALKRGLDKACGIAIDSLSKISRPIEEGSDDVLKVATISANNDPEVGKIIADAIKKSGKNGVITIEESKTMTTHLESIPGMELDKGYMSPFMVTDQEKMKAIYENPLILIVDDKINNIKEFIPILEQVGQTGRPFFIVAEDIDPDIVATLVINKMKAGFKVVATRSPSYGDNRSEMLSDLAVFTGATIVSQINNLSLKNVTLSDLGTCRKVTVDSNSSLIEVGAGDPVKLEERIKSIQGRINNMDSEYEKDKLRKRLAKLTDGIVTINIAAKSEVEMKELRDRYDDAIHATKAAIEEGIVPGGGVSLIRASQSLVEFLKTDDFDSMPEDEKAGVKMLIPVLSQPTIQISDNAGVNGGIVAMTISNNQDINFGYDAKNDQYGDMISFGIIDPTKVERTVLETAVSIVGTLLTTECVITDVIETKDSCNCNSQF